MSRISTVAGTRRSPCVVCLYRAAQELGCCSNQSRSAMRLQAWRFDAVSALFLCRGAPDRWQADGDKLAGRWGSTSLSGDSKYPRQLFVAGAVVESDRIRRKIGGRATEDGRPMGAGFVEVKTTYLGGCFWTRDLATDASGGFVKTRCPGQGGRLVRHAQRLLGRSKWNENGQTSPPRKNNRPHVTHARLRGPRIPTTRFQFTSCWPAGCQGA